MKILIIGHSGQLAHELERSLACLGEVTTLGRKTTPPVDLMDLNGLEATLPVLAPDLIVNAAAYTQVDRAETETEAALRINAESLKVICEACLKLKSPLIHFSTDYVFDGTARSPYQEVDETRPQSVYGESKLKGEEIIRASGIPHFIFRTAWIYSLHGQNFLKTMLRLLSERDKLLIVDDQIGAPTWSRQIAEATALCIQHTRSVEGNAFETLSGTYHLTAAGSTSWCGFARKIRSLGIERGYLKPEAASIQPIPTSDYPTPAKRPAYSVLDNQRTLKTFGIRMPHWESGLSLCLEPRAAETPS